MELSSDPKKREMQLLVRETAIFDAHMKATFPAWLIEREKRAIIEKRA